jgi:hypothetical protein
VNDEDEDEDFSENFAIGNGNGRESIIPELRFDDQIYLTATKVGTVTRIPMSSITKP